MDYELECQIDDYLNAIDKYNKLTGLEKLDCFMDVALLGQTVILSLLVTIAEK